MLWCSVLASAAQDSAALPSPRETGWVVDQARLLAPGELAALGALGDAVRRQNGAELAVLTVRSTGGADHRAFATAVFNEWRLGDRTRHNGVLVFVAIDDRAAEIVLGDGIDSDAQVAVSDRIMQQVIVPRFRSGDNAGAILAGARACAAEFFGVSEAGPIPPRAPVAATTPVEGVRSDTWPQPGAARSGPRPWWFFAAGGTGIGGVLAWAVGRVVARSRPRRCRQCAMTMQRLDEAADDAQLDDAERAEEKIGSVDYDVWLCPGCSAVEKVRYGRWFTRYSRCPSCHAVTKSETQQTLVAATTMSTGLVEVHEKCAHCSYQHTSRRSTPRIVRSSSSRSSSGGGGHSSGRGSSGRW